MPILEGRADVSLYGLVDLNAPEAIAIGKTNDISFGTTFNVRFW